MTGNLDPYYVPTQEIARRLSAFQEILASEGIGLAWVEYLTDLYYLTGSIQNGVFLVPCKGDPVFYVRKSMERAKKESSVRVESFPGRKPILKQAKEMMGSGLLGLSMDVTPASTYLWLTAQLQTQVRDVSAAIRRQRAVKSSWELSQIQKAAEQASTLISEVPDLLRPGMTELEASVRMEMRLREMGHPGPIRMRSRASDPGMLVLVSGDSALFPTNFDGPVGGEGLYPSTAAGAGRKALKKGETLMLDVVTAWNGYHADTSRMFLLGAVPDAVLKAHEFCLEALHRLQTALLPGRSTKDVYEEVMSWAETKTQPEGFMGYGENRVRFFGHGVGLELDELPIVTHGLDMILEKDMVLALEPKAFLKGIGPAGAENTVRVTEKGAVALAAIPEEPVPVKGF